MKLLKALLAAILATARNWRFYALILILIAGGSFAASTSKIMRVTAYCHCRICCGQYGDKMITASGYKIRKGDKLVAAPKNYKFGTLLLIKGYSDKPVKVLDRGGAIKGDRLDVYFDTHKEAMNWGVKYIKVEVVNGN